MRRAHCPTNGRNIPTAHEDRLSPRALLRLWPHRSLPQAGFVGFIAATAAYVGHGDRQALCRVHMTEGDLDEALRGQGLVSLERVAEARLERNGKVSVLEAKPKFNVVEVQVTEGVQTIRIEFAQG